MSTISNTTIVGRLEGKFVHQIYKWDEASDILNIEADPSVNLEILKFLFEDGDFKFQFLTDLCGIHYPDQALSLGVIYHLHSFTNNKRIRLKFFLPVENPNIRSAVPLFAGANWMERETYDFFGIIFDGHPDLRRILNVDEMEAFPLRKEFPLEDPNRLDKQDKYFGR